MGFRDDAEARTTAAFRGLIAGVTDRALGELEALRVAFDVRCEALTAALAGSSCIDPTWLHGVVDQLALAAGEEADAAARASRSQALEEAQARSESERAEADKRLALVRAESAAQREADQLEHAALTKALAQARAEVDAIRARTRAQLEAASDAQTRLLEETHAQLEAARIDAERAVAAGLDATEDLRAQLEDVRALAQRAQAETDRVEKAAEIRLETARAEFEAHRASEAATRALLPPGGANAPGDLLGRLSTALRTIDEAASLPPVLDALLDCVGALFPRAALFIVHSDQLQGWRSIGFDGVTAITKQFAWPLTNDSVLTRAVATGRAVVTDDSRVPGADRAAAEGGPWTVTLPVGIGSRVVAVVYADEGARTGDSALSLDRRMAVNLTDMLIRHAGQRLAALTSTPRMVGGGLAPQAPITLEAVDASAARARQEEPRRLEDAKRYARLLVSEIKRYQQAHVLAALPDRSLQERLKDEIERCRSLYARRVPPDAGATNNCFDEALVEMLGGGDVDEGPLAQTAGAPPASASVDRLATDRLATPEQPLSVRT